MKEEKKVFLRIIKDRFFLIIILILSLSTMIPILLIFFHIFANGILSINKSFLMELPKPVGEAGGGILNAIVGTGMLVIIASVLAIPVSIIAGIYLAENRKSKISSILALFIDILQGTPSIILGITAYVWIVRPMKHFSMLSGSIALGIMMIPVIVKSTEETLKLIPDYIREATLALGVPYYKMVLKVLLPISMSGIISGILIGVSRIAGETAPLLFTAFGNPFLNLNPLKPVDSLPLVIFNYAKSPFIEWHKLAWGASLVLIVFVLITNIFIRWLTRKWKIQF